MKKILSQLSVREHTHRVIRMLVIIVQKDEVDVEAATWILSGDERP